VRLPSVIRRGAEVVAALAISDLRVRYGRGRLRSIKWLLDPYAAAGVYLLLIAFVLDRPGHAPGLSIACAIVPFQLVMATTINALTSVQLRGSIILNMAFRRMLIPVASAVTEGIAFAASLTLLALMMAAYAVAPTAAVAWLPLILVVTFLFALGLAYPAALVGLWYQELNTFIVSGVRTAFFLAAGVVALGQTHGGAHLVLSLNPLTAIFESYRDVLLHGRAPAAWELVFPLAVSVLLLCIFVPLFNREQSQFAKVIE